MSYHQTIWNFTKYPETLDDTTPHWHVSQNQWVHEYLSKLPGLKKIDRGEGYCPLYEIPAAVVLGFVKQLATASADITEQCWQLNMEWEDAEQEEKHNVPTSYMLSRIFRQARQRDNVVAIHTLYEDWEGVTKQWIADLLDVVADMNPGDVLRYEAG